MAETDVGGMTTIGAAAERVLTRTLARMPAGTRRAVLDGMSPDERAKWEQRLQHGSD